MKEAAHAALMERLPDDAAPLEYQVFRYMAAEPKSMDQGVSIYVAGGSEFHFERLVMFGLNGELLPGAAQSWEPYRGRQDLDLSPAPGRPVERRPARHGPRFRIHLQAVPPSQRGQRLRLSLLRHQGRPGLQPAGNGRRGHRGRPGRGRLHPGHRDGAVLRLPAPYHRLPHFRARPALAGGEIRGPVGACRHLPDQRTLPARDVENGPVHDLRPEPPLHRVQSRSSPPDRPHIQRHGRIGQRGERHGTAALSKTTRST